MDSRRALNPGFWGRAVETPFELERAPPGAVPSTMPLSPRHHHPSSDFTSSSSDSKPDGVPSEDGHSPEDAEFLSSFGKGEGVGQ